MPNVLKQIIRAREKLKYLEKDRGPFAQDEKKMRDQLAQKQIDKILMDSFPATHTPSWVVRRSNGA